MKRKTKIKTINEVDSTHPVAEAGHKGQTVRLLKRYVSWVQYVVRQYGYYPYLVL